MRGSARDDAETAAASADAIAGALVPHGGVTDDGMLQVAVGPAGVHSDGERTFALLAEVAAAHGLRRRTQANEQVDVRDRRGAVRPASAGAARGVGLAGAGRHAGPPLRR